MPGTSYPGGFEPGTEAGLWGTLPGPPAPKPEEYGPSSVNAVAIMFYEAMAPLAYADKELGYPLLRLCDAFSSMWADLDPIIRDKIVEKHRRIPGYSILMTLQECPSIFLPWLSQFSGVQAPPNNPVLDRELIIGAEGMHRGTAEAIEKRVKLLLTGKQRVSVFERYENKAYRMLVVTFGEETPVTKATIEKAIEEVVPVGMILTVVIAEAWIYFEVPVEEPTYKKVWETDYKTYKGLATHQKGK